MRRTDRLDFSTSERLSGCEFSGTVFRAGRWQVFSGRGGVPARRFGSSGAGRPAYRLGQFGGVVCQKAFCDLAAFTTRGHLRTPPWAASDFRNSSSIGRVRQHQTATIESGFSDQTGGPYHRLAWPHRLPPDSVRSPLPAHQSTQKRPANDEGPSCGFGGNVVLR